MNIFDLGAYIGFYVMLEAQIISRGSGKIIATELGTENIRLLRLSIAANDYENRVKVFHGAVTTGTGTVQLRISTASNCYKIEELSTSSTAGDTIDVPAYTFDDLLKSACITIEQIDFCRMDI